MATKTTKSKGIALAGLKTDPIPHHWSELRDYVHANKASWMKCTFGRRKNSYLGYNIPCAFDIETNNAPPLAWHVCWQIGIAGASFYGRTWDEMREAFDILVDELELDCDNRLIFFIHNEGFEWGFIRKQLPFVDGFTGEPRSPYKVWTSTGLEFRDSLVLSGLSLEKTIALKVANSTVSKLCGSWDYTKQRHEQTDLTDEEIRYACYDVLCLMEYIYQLMEQEGGYLSKVPMTRTGYVRRDCRRAAVKDKKYQKLMDTLQVTVDEYRDLKQAYSGGFTHASNRYVSFNEEDGTEHNKVIQNVGSFDFTSSYPACLVQFKYPMGVAIYHAVPKSEQHFRDMLNEYCCLLDVTLLNVKEKITYEHIISESKCIELEFPEGWTKNHPMDNGRVVRADSLRMVITEQDYFSLEEFYDFDLQLHDMTCYYKEYLPTTLVDRILYYYEQKTTLKGVDGRETEYMLYKEMVNAIYGMMVEDPVHPTYEMIDGEFVRVKDDDPEDYEEDEETVAAINRYNTKWGRFLYYPWGVWCTAYARRCLLRGIVACGNNYIYADTDSIKYVKENSDHFLQYVERYNAEVKERMEAAMKHHKFPADRWAPCDIKGNAHPLGYWDPEHDMDEFKVLGAKRYFYRIGDKYTVTLAGSNKKKTGEYLASQPKPFEAFCHGLCIPAGVSGRLVATYIDHPIDGIATDFNGVSAPFHELSAVCLEESEYNLTMSDPFLMYLRGEILLDIVA